MRICVITFPFGTNYGGVLQCYAMNEELKKLGHDVTFLRYWGKGDGRLTNIWRTCRSSKSLTNFLSRLYQSFKIRIKQKGLTPDFEKQKLFDDFRESYLKFTPVLRPETIGEYLNNNFDAVIVGSDQVWTDVASSDKVYFIGWSPSFKGLRIAYAACSAHSAIAKRVHNEFRTLLDKFDLLTVRDRTTASLVKSISGKQPKIVPDPTILHDFKEFQNNKPVKEDYIVTYILGSEITGGHKEALERIKTLMNKKLRVIGIITNKSHHSLIECVDDTRYSVSPKEWVTLISNASAVYTDSFHAIIFSMKFNKPFVAYYADRIRSSRLLDLKNEYNLKSIVKSAQEITELSQIQIPKQNLSTFLNIL